MRGRGYTTYQSLEVFRFVWLAAGAEIGVRSGHFPEFHVVTKPLLELTLQGAFYALMIYLAGQRRAFSVTGGPVSCRGVFLSPVTAPLRFRFSR
jgi:hypothetical protein